MRRLSLDSLREDSTGRFRASVRGIVPVLVTLVIMVVGIVLVESQLLGLFGEPSTTAIVTILSAQSLVFVVMIVVALWLARWLDERPLSAYGFRGGWTWVRNVVAGFCLSALAVLGSFAYGAARGYVRVDPSELSIDGQSVTLAVAVVLGAFFLLIASQVVLEELVYRGIVLRNFAEGLYARGTTPSLAIAVATGTSLVAFGLAHAPLRGPVVAVDAMVVGLVFALAFLLTGQLGLAMGVHLGRLPLELLVGTDLEVLTLPTVVQPQLDGATVVAERAVVEVVLTAALVTLWVYLTDGRVGVASSIYESDRYSD